MKKVYLRHIKNIITENKKLPRKKIQEFDKKQNLFFRELLIKRRIHLCQM